jgi:hypothetical protein
MLLLAICSTLVESTPLASPDEIKTLDDVKNAWDKNELHEIEGPDGQKYKLTTRDIIIIAVASFLVLLILICCIGYCFCECVKSLICCICCCGRD